MPVWQPLVVVGGLLDVGVGVFEDAVGVAVGVHAGLAGVESGWGDPFDGAVVYSDRPTRFGESVVRAAGEHFDVDVGR